MIEEKTDLYRAYSRNGTLLYIGISLSAMHRAKQHRRHSKWFQDSYLMRIESFKTRQAALQAERLAIMSEKPLFNVVYNNRATEQVMVSSAAAPRQRPNSGSVSIQSLTRLIGGREARARKAAWKTEEERERGVAIEHIKSRLVSSGMDPSLFSVEELISMASS